MKNKSAISPVVKPTIKWKRNTNQFHLCLNGERDTAYAVTDFSHLLEGLQTEAAESGVRYMRIVAGLTSVLSPDEIEGLLDALLEVYHEKSVLRVG